VVRQTMAMAMVVSVRTVQYEGLYEEVLRGTDGVRAGE
jgi:hypothetical protein